MSELLKDMRSNCNKWLSYAAYYGHVKLDEDDVEKIRQLIDRVEVMEKLNASLSEESRVNFESARKYNKENQRYKQALEKIAEHETFGIDIVSHEFATSDVGKIARQALEGLE